MTRYLLSIYQPDGPTPDPEFLEPIVRDLETWNREVREANAWVFSGGLHPASTSTVVRVKDGDELLTDGPFTEGKEHLGGFTVISAPDLDAALGWARKLAAATTLPIEVRPFFDDDDGSCAGT
ncbi:YciI family protein [Actinomycetes bacterium KLBMP 9759]